MQSKAGDVIVLICEVLRRAVNDSDDVRAEQYDVKTEETVTIITTISTVATLKSF